MILLVFLILLHSGKDAGMSGAFGIGGGGSSIGGGSMVERNLNRATVAVRISPAAGAASGLKSTRRRPPRVSRPA